MSLLLRQLCISLVIIVLINCSQGYSIGYGTESDQLPQDPLWQDNSAVEDKRSQGKHLRTGKNRLGPDSVSEEEDEILDDADKRAPYLKIGKREVMPLFRDERASAGDKTFLRIGRAPSDSTFLRIGRSPFLRVRKAPFLRIGRAPFLRIGRSPFLRIGRTPGLRIGRSSYPMVDQRSNDKSFLRIGRANEMPNDDTIEAVTEDTDETIPDETIDSMGTMEKRGLRIGKRIFGAFSQGTSNDLTSEELRLLKENKAILLEYMERHPELFDGKNGDEDAYFAFPRQGRAMSFYFPRMGRSGDEELNSPYCCEEGVRKVFKIGKGAQELCSGEKPCCPGFEEQEKMYKDIIITECAAKSTSDKFRNFLGDE